MRNQEVAVEQTFCLERSRFFYLSALMARTNATSCLYFAHSCTKYRPQLLPLLLEVKRAHENYLQVVHFTNTPNHTYFPPPLSRYTFRGLTLSSVRLSGDVGGMEEGEAMGVGTGEGEGEGEGVWCRRVEAGTLVRRSNFFKEAARTEKGEPGVIHLMHHNMGQSLRKHHTMTVTVW